MVAFCGGGQFIAALVVITFVHIGHANRLSLAHVLQSGAKVAESDTLDMFNSTHKSEALLEQESGDCRGGIASGGNPCNDCMATESVCGSSCYVDTGFGGCERHGCKWQCRVRKEIETKAKKGLYTFTGEKMPSLPDGLSEEDLSSLTDFMRLAQRGDLLRIRAAGSKLVGEFVGRALGGSPRLEDPKDLYRSARLTSTEKALLLMPEQFPYSGAHSDIYTLRSNTPAHVIEILDKVESDAEAPNETKKSLQAITQIRFKICEASRHPQIPCPF